MARSAVANRIIIPDRQNYVLQSENFNTSPWGLGTGITITENSSDVTDPLGGNTASKMVYTGGGSDAATRLNQSLSANLPTGSLKDGVFALALWFRLATGTGTLPLRLTDNNGHNLFFTATDTWGTVPWSFIAAARTDNTSAFIYNLTGVAGSNGAFTAYLWGAQVCRNRLSPYVKTTSSAVGTAGLRVPTASRVAIPQVQNLCLQSENLNTSPWSKNTGTTVAENTTDVTDPFGGNAASKIVYDGSGVDSGTRLFQSIAAVVAAQSRGFTYTTSIWVRNTSGSTQIFFNDNGGASLIITPTTSWVRYSITGVRPDATSALRLAIAGVGGQNGAFTFYLYGGHTAQTNRLTPYIKTTSSAVNTGALRITP
jgi:hypothetical protein